MHGDRPTVVDRCCLSLHWPRFDCSPLARQQRIATTTKPYACLRLFTFRVHRVLRLARKFDFGAAKENVEACSVRATFSVEKN